MQLVIVLTIDWIMIFDFVESLYCILLSLLLIIPNGILMSISCKTVEYL